MTIRITLFAIILCFLSFTGLSAQSFEEYKKWMTMDFNQYKDSNAQAFEEYRASINKTFAEFLRNAWVQIYGNEPIPVPKKIPDIPPVIVPENDIPETPDGDEFPVTDIIPIVIDEKPIPIAPIMPVKAPKESKIDGEYYGTLCTVRFDMDKKYQMKDASEASTADMWCAMSESDYTNILADCLEIKERLKLCDWAYYQFVDKAAYSVYGDSNERVMLEAYILCQSGYKLRLGRDNRNVLHLLLSFNEDLFEYGYYTLDDGHYYLIDKSKVGMMVICDQKFPSEKSLRMSIDEPMIFKDKPSSPRNLSSKRYPEIKVSATVNENLMRFYTDYPKSFRRGSESSTWAFYANTSISESVTNSIYPALMAEIEGKCQADAANCLINFVQTAFDYRTDDEYWGHERFFFPEETLYYPFSDCEDRAILFSRLIRDLMGLKVVLVDYPLPPHLAAAVEFTDGSMAGGDYVIVNNHKYIISDPTYIGAPVGETMPGMDNSEAIIILLEQYD